MTALLLCLIGAAAAEENDEEAPGWKITASSEVTLDARAAFDRAAAGLAVAVAVYAAVKSYPEHYDAEGKLLVDGAKNGT